MSKAFPLTSWKLWSPTTAPVMLESCRISIERSVILTKGPVLRPPLNELRPKRIPSNSSAKTEMLEEIEREHILQGLPASKWVISGPRGAAARLGLNTQLGLGSADSSASCLTLSEYFPALTRNDLIPSGFETRPRIRIRTVPLLCHYSVLISCKS